MNKNYEAIHRYDFLTKDLLQEEYIINKLTDKQIAKKYNMPSKVVVWRKRQEYKIPNRNPSKSNKNATINRKFQIKKEDAIKLLDEGKTFKEISGIIGCSLIVAKRRFKELGLTSERKQVKNFTYYNIDLISSQKQLLIGSSLGDGTITKHSAFACRHSEKQAKYILHKMKLLKNIHSGSSHYIAGIDPFGNPTRAISFTTGCNKFIEELGKVFYINNIKIFPFDFCMKFLEAEGLAYWYMDDGSYHGGNSTLHTEGFTEIDIGNIQLFFGQKFNLIGKLHKRGINKKGNKKFSFGFSRESTKKFIEIIEPYIIETMKYKIGCGKTHEEQEEEWASIL